MSIASDLVARYYDTCTAEHRDEMKILTGRMARPIVDALKHGATEQQLEEALLLFVQRRVRNPWKLVEIAVEIAHERSRTPATRPSVRRTTSTWIHEHGWPTGCRLARGQVGMSFVHDVLGLERPPGDWPHPRPSFDDVATALTERGLA